MHNLGVCSSCRCHVRTGELVCPHCGASLVAAEAWRVPQRALVEVARTFVAATLTGAGILTSGCGPLVQAPVVPDASSTAGPDASLASNDAGGVGTDAGPDCTVTGCEYGSYCPGSGSCVACGCDAGTYCNSEGQCTSSHPCYGAPPVLA
jgi:hypothetical protein